MQPEEPASRMTLAESSESLQKELASRMGWANSCWSSLELGLRIQMDGAAGYKEKNPLFEATTALRLVMWQ